MDEGLEPLVVHENEASFEDHGEHGSIRKYLDFPSYPGRLTVARMRLTSEGSEYHYPGNECEHTLLLGLSGHARFHTGKLTYRLEKERLAYIPPFSQAVVTEPDNFELLSIDALVTTGTDKHAPLVVTKKQAAVQLLPQTSGKRVNYRANDLTHEDLNVELHMQTSRFPAQGSAVNNQSHQALYIMQGRGVIGTLQGGLTEWPIEAGSVFFLPKNLPFYIQGALKAAVISYRASSLAEYEYFPAAVEANG